MQNYIQIPWQDWDLGPIIGRGGFGTVHRIEKDLFGKKEIAALKILSIPETQEEIDELYSRGYDERSISAHYKQYLEDIVAEYSIMLDLKGHGNIVYCDEVRYTQHDDGIGWNVFIKMELLKPLTKIMSTEYNEEEVVRLGKDICNALIYCGQKRIIHRDIKPQNIFASDNGSFKLGDFGVAKVSDKTMSGTKIGTYEYMAPEVYRAQRYGSRVDIYSLGLVMYWMMNQKCTPFLPLPPQIPTSSEKENARNRRLDGEQLPPPVNGSDRLKAIVLKACAFDLKDRYASAQDMLNALINMNAANPDPIPEPVDLDVHKEMTFEHTNHPAGKYLSIQVDTREVHFSVPMDIKDGQTIHLRGKGNYDTSTGISGDLYITVHIKATPPQPPLPIIKQYIAIAAVAVVLAIILMIPKNKTSTAIPPTSNNPQTPQVSVQEETPKATTPQVTPHIHSWKEATYTAPKTCISCGATEGDILEKEATLETPSEGMIAAGNYHSVYLKSDGTVYAVGSEKLSEYDNRGKRCDTWDWENIVAVSAASHTVGLRKDGTVVAVGVDKYGQCSVDNWSDVIEVYAGDNHTVGLRKDGTVIAVGDNSDGQCNVSSWRNIIAVAAGEKTTYGLTKDGKVLSVGKKNYGSSWNNIVAISAGPYHLVGLKNDGTVVQTGGCDSWKKNTDNWSGIIAISAGSAHTVGLRSDGSVVAVGSENSDKGQCEVGSWSDIIQIDAGMYHTVGLKSDGTIVAVGNNGYRQLDIAN